MSSCPRLYPPQLDGTRFPPPMGHGAVLMPGDVSQREMQLLGQPNMAKARLFASSVGILAGRFHLPSFSNHQGQVEVEAVGTSALGVSSAHGPSIRPLPLGTEGGPGYWLGYMKSFFGVIEGRCIWTAQFFIPQSISRAAPSSFPSSCWSQRPSFL